MSVILVSVIFISHDAIGALVCDASNTWVEFSVWVCTTGMSFVNVCGSEAADIVFNGRVCTHDGICIGRANGCHSACVVFAVVL